MSNETTKELKELIGVISYLITGEVVLLQQQALLIKDSDEMKRFMLENTGIMSIPVRLPKEVVCRLQELINEETELSPEKQQDILSCLLGAIFISGANTLRKSNPLSTIAELISRRIFDGIFTNEN